MCVCDLALSPPLCSRTYSYSEPQLYSQNSGGNYFDTQGGSSQVTTVVSSHGMANNGGGGGGGAAGMGMGLTGGQLISSSGAYLIGGSNSMDNATAHPTAQTPRASPATVSVSGCFAPVPFVLCVGGGNL